MTGNCSKCDRDLPRGYPCPKCTADDDFDDDETNLEPTQAHAAAPEANPMNDLLLELISAMPRLVVHLTEADEAEWKAAKPRLETFLALVDAVPRKPSFREPLGFKAPKKKKSRAKKTKGGK